MKIAFDVQALFEEKKTGIGWTIEKLIENMDMSLKTQYQLNYFAFRRKKIKRVFMQRFLEKGYQLAVCGWFPLAVYRRIWNVIPIPYSWLVRKDSDITQFFNYIIPPGVKGKAGVYIYDMVYRACPETMEDITRRVLEQNVERSCKRADFIITVSEFSKKEIHKYLGIPEKNIYVVPCGVDLAGYRSDIDIRDVKSVKQKYGIAGNYYLYLGTLEPRKNIPLILRAYWELKSQVGESAPQLVIAGKKGWDYQQIFEQVKQYGLEKKVVFTGYILEDEKPALLKGAIGFLFPSLYEGFGMPPLEAMACGTPVIVSNRASLPEVVGKAGILVEPDDHESMACWMRELYENIEYRNQMAQLGIERAQLYTWENSVKTLLNIYAEIL